MRRLNTRKRNHINFKKWNKKALRNITILTILIFVFVFIYYYFIQNSIIKKSFEKDFTHFSQLNEEVVFSLDKIVIFSSATAQAQEVNNSVWNLDISQYADIAIYLHTFPNANTSKNKIQQLYIDHIDVSNPEYGKPYLYQKSLEDFGRCTFAQEKIVSDKIDLNIVEAQENTSRQDDIIYNLSTPITLGFYNQNVKENFMDASSHLEYNGKILKRASIPQKSIQCNVSFDIHLQNELNEEYICNVSIAIPFENENESIYENGYIIKEMNHLENYQFLRLR